MIADWGSCHCFAHGRVSLIGPFDASSGGIERVDHSGGAAHEDMSIDNGGLRVSGNVAVETESPFQFELADLADGEAGLIGGLEARIIRCRAPAIPRKRRVLFQADGALFAKCFGFGTGLGAGRAEVRRHRYAFIAAQRIGGGHHDAGIHGAENSHRRHFLQGCTGRDARTGLIVAAGAALFVEGFSGGCLGVNGYRGGEQGNAEERNAVHRNETIMERLSYDSQRVCPTVVLSSISDDFENVDQITLPDVARTGAKCGILCPGNASSPGCRLWTR